MGYRFADQFSILHCATGVIAYFWRVPLVTAVLLHIAFELVENTQQGMSMINKVTVWPGGKRNADSPINMMGDTIFFAMGWIIAQQLDARLKGNTL